MQQVPGDTFSHEARAVLTGWGPFLFTMSMHQAMAAAGTGYQVTPIRKLEYPCTIGGESYTAILGFTKNERRIERISITKNGGTELEAPALVAAYENLVALLTEKYGPPDSADSPVTFPGKAIGQHGPTATTAFRFADGGMVEVVEGTGWLSHIVVRYTPAPAPTPLESF